MFETKKKETPETTRDFAMKNFSDRQGTNQKTTPAGPGHNPRPTMGGGQGAKGGKVQI